MNLQDVIELVNEMIEQHRIETGGRLGTTPVTWEGISMTVKEAKLAIQKLEAVKAQHPKTMNKTQMGGEITKLAAIGAGLAAMVTGAVLMLFSPTAIAGVITFIAGIGAAGVGKIVGDGIKDIGSNNSVRGAQQIDAYIDSIKNAIIDSI